ncbi:MAG: GspMb/PilO family protein, partial [Gammaproteobacteria bacterium]
LMLAGIVAAIFAANSLLPAVRDIYDQREANIDNISIELAREQRLIEDTVRWRERRVVAQARRAEMEAQVFVGNTVPIIEANIQRSLSQLARDSGITVNSTRLAEQLQSDGWLLVSQEMSFRTNDAGSTIRFLEYLETSIPRLWVTDFSLTRSRNQYTGSITVVGFARSDGIAGLTTASR